MCNLCHPLTIFISLFLFLYPLSQSIFPAHTPLLFPSPVFLIAKSMLKVCKQGVSGTASEHGYPLPPLLRSLCVYVCVCLFPVSPHTNTHHSICSISTCSETQPPGKLTNKSLPQPSVVFLAAFSSCIFSVLSIPPPLTRLPLPPSLIPLCIALSLVWLQLLCQNSSFDIVQHMKAQYGLALITTLLWLQRRHTIITQGKNSPCLSVRISLVKEKMCLFRCE